MLCDYAYSGPPADNEKESYHKLLCAALAHLKKHPEFIDEVINKVTQRARAFVEKMPWDHKTRQRQIEGAAGNFMEHLLNRFSYNKDTLGTVMSLLLSRCKTRRMIELAKYALKRVRYFINWHNTWAQ